LRAENELITNFDEDLHKLIRDMFRTMYATHGIGLAAPQVGVNKRLMVFNEFGDPTDADSEVVLINPQIISKSEDMVSSEEGCLSFPMISAEVERHYRIEVDFQNQFGEKKNVILEDDPSIIFQHEYDHLDKILLVDRMCEGDEDMFSFKLKKLVERFGPDGAL
jgi:peptide deformylase